MATDAVHTQEFLVRNLQTRSVTLYPTKAHIIRDVASISLKPGPNQIVIEGLTPTVDEHSIKVEGTGAATITDMTVQLVPNREVYEDIYPSDDEDEEESEEEIDSDQEDDSIKPVTAEIKKLEAEHAETTEIISSALARLNMLDGYSSTLSSERPENLEKCLKEYRDERAKAYSDQINGETKVNDLNEQIRTLTKKKARLGKAAMKAKAKVQAELYKKRVKKDRKIQEARQEKARVKAERVKFWPKKVYKVIVSLDAPSGSTPGTSRRGSVDSLVKVASPSETGATPEGSKIGDVNLSISYITYSASWSPRYDLSLNSITGGGALDYCAELRNTTSETWRDTKVVLSTSQTSYQGLGDTIPILQPWHVRLVKNGYGKNSSSFGSKGPALYSQYEQDQKVKNRKEIPAQIFAPRNELFGLDSNYYAPQRPQRPLLVEPQSFYASNQPQMPMQQMQQMQQQAQQVPMRNIELSKKVVATSTYSTQSALSAPKPAPPEKPSGSLFGGPAAASNLFGSASTAGPGTSLFCSTSTAPGTNIIGATSAAEGASIFGGANFHGNRTNAFGASGSARRSTSLFSAFGGGGRGGLAPPPAPMASAAPGGYLGSAPADGGSAEADLIDYSDGGDGGDDDETISTQDPALLFEESSFSDSGMTTTYDVPTLKTLAPTSSTTKHKIARIDFKNIAFSHVLIPKLKPSAFLKARLRNASKIALLKGPAGLTLDGSFMGQSSIPRCSAGESFTLPLGVDPTINVSYAKPTVRRSQSGIFSKEDCEVYTRQAVVTNTKHNAAVELQVLDQVPISEDERLRIEIVSPRGLRIGGDSIPAGLGVVSGSSDTAVESDAAAAVARSPAGKSRMSVYGDNGIRATGSGKEVGKWGSATAIAKKDGEVNWSVKINPLRGCKLILEYEATYPGGETVSGIN